MQFLQKIKNNTTTLIPAVIFCFYCSSSGQIFASDEAIYPENKAVNLEGEINLETAMNLGEANSFSALISTQSRKEFEHKESQTLALFGPRIDFDAQRIWISKDVNKAVGNAIGGTKIPDRITTASFTISQPIITLGVFYLKLQADIISTKTSINEEKQSKNDARFAGAEAFLRSQKAMQFLKIAQASFALVEKQRQDGLALERNGKLGKADILRLEFALSDAKAQLAQAQAMQEIALTGFRETVGIPQTKPIKLATMQESIFASKINTLPQLQEALDKAKNDRVEISSALTRVETAEKLKKASDFDYLPTLNAFAKYERDLEAESINIPASPASPAVNYAKKDLQDKFTYGLMLKWNLWDWGSRIARSNEFAESIQKARIGKNAQESRVRMEVTQAYMELVSAHETYESAKSSLNFAEEVYRLQNVKFINGTATTTDIITAERDQTRARGGLVNSMSDYDLAWLKLQKTMGNEIKIN